MSPRAQPADRLPPVLRSARWLLWVVAVALAACGEGSEQGLTPATPAAPAESLVVGSEGYVPPEAMDLLRSEAERAGLRIDFQRGSGALTLTSHEIPDSEPIFVRYWVPVVGPFRPLRELSTPQLLAMATGHLSDWSALTGEGGPIRLLLPEEHGEELTALLKIPLTRGPQEGHVELKPLREIPSLVIEDQSALALLPADAVDARLRSLAVDGTNAVTGKGDLHTYPLATRAWVRGESQTDLPAELASARDEIVASLNSRPAAPTGQPIRLLFTGDIMPGRCVYAHHLAYGDFRHAFLKLSPLLRGADITVGSLDTSLSDAGEPMGCVPTYNLLAPPESVEGLAFAGFDLLTLATNHAKDCGSPRSACDEALLDTIANLRAAGIAPVGAGSDLLEARKPAIISVRGTRFAFLGYDDIAPYYHADEGSPGTAPLEASFLREDIARALQAADVVVVLPHWGTEYTSMPTERQREMARMAIEAGATLVIGNHPHWPQAVEYFEEAFVAYALGNFVFDQDWSLETQQGVVLEAVFQGSRLVSVDLVPIRILDMHQPTLAPAEEAGEILRRIHEASGRLR
ncbi:MAG: CapA family protein [Dehalococcoidia bacterium]